MMALIKAKIPEGEEEKVEALFKSIEGALGSVPDGLRLLGNSPVLLENMMGNIGYFTGHKELSQDLLFMVRYLNSEEVSCSFCIGFTESVLINHLGKTSEQLQAAKENPDHAPLTEKEKVLLKIALASSTNPQGVSQDDLQKARDVGFSERNMLDVVAAAAYNKAFTYILRTFKIEGLQGSFA